ECWLWPSERADKLLSRFPNLLNTPPSLSLEFCLGDLDRSRLILENTLVIGCNSCHNTHGRLRRTRAHLGLVKLALFFSQPCSARRTYWIGPLGRPCTKSNEEMNSCTIRVIGCNSCHNTRGRLRRTRAHLGLVKLALFFSQPCSARQTWVGWERIVHDFSCCITGWGDGFDVDIGLGHWHTIKVVVVVVVMDQTVDEDVAVDVVMAVAKGVDLDKNMDRVAQLINDDEDICLVDSATTHTILKKEKYSSRLNLQESNVNIISCSAKLIKGYGKAHILLPGDFPIKTIHLDNASEFTSHTFNDYCMSIGISVEHSVAHVHTQNRLAESLTKRIQMIARPMIIKAKLLVFACGHDVLHVATLIRIKPTSHRTYSTLQLVFGQELHISHLRIFSCAVYVLIAPPQRTKIGPQRRMGIYVGYDSSSIIRYLEPSTRDLFTARFVDCHFDESVFQTLRGDKKQLGCEISWNELSLSHLDPRTKECEQEVQRIIHLQGPIDSKDKNPRKKKGAYNQDGQVEVKDTLEGSSIRTLDMMVQEEPRVPKDEEILGNYVMSRMIWNRNEIEVDDTFAYNVALEIMEDLQRRLYIAETKKEGIQLNVNKLENSSKSLNKIIECQIVDNCKKGLGYNAVPPPLTGLFPPLKSDLSFTGLEELFNEPKAEKSKDKSIEVKPESIRKGSDAPIIED
nr:retrovirus-related Pol polyprotein from transposon TNT 1-94 [Tanacetum cinerariifolium]